MNILLINPPYSLQERYGKNLAKFGPTTEPLGLAYVAASLEKAGYGVSLLDAAAENLDQEAISQRLKQSSFDLVGITMLTPMYKCSIETVRTVRSAAPQAKIVVGGVHPSILPVETLKDNPQIDIAVVGEGEITAVELARAIEAKTDLKGIPGVCFRDGANIVLNASRPLLKDIDMIPMPSRHLLPMDLYKMTASRSRKKRCYTIIIARGCPFRCTYCSHPFGRAFRHHSVERIIEELKELVNIYGAQEINFEADTLTIDKDFLSALCRRLIQEGYAEKIKWTCESRVDTVDKEMLLLMRKAGCWEISYGVESGSQRLLDLIKKDCTLEQVEKVFKITREAGISIRAFFMLGLPTETRKESLETINFAKKLDAAWSQFTVTVPYPGTELFELAKKDNTLKSYNWEDYRTWAGWTESDAVFVPAGRSAAELKELQKQALREFYLRPGTILKFLKKIDSWSSLKKYIDGAWFLLIKRK